MNISDSMLRKITRGVVNIENNDGKYSFRRFSDRQMEVYYNSNLHFYEKSHTTAGVNFDFYTDSKAFSFAYEATPASSRSFYYFDIFIDGIMVKHLGESNMWMMKGDVSVDIAAFGLPASVRAAGEGADIPVGMHRVTVWFPNSVNAVLQDICLDDGAQIIPRPPKLKILSYGDSITQGYDAQFPSCAYLSRVSRHFDADTVNLAIGGETFPPQIIDKNLNFKPDILTVAYGSNDWSKLTPELFERGVNDFTQKAAELYSDIPRFLILPIWRADLKKKTKSGTFDDAREFIRRRAIETGFHVIDGWMLVPHIPEFFGDLRLHPNDNGFAEYACGVIAEMEKYI